MALTFPLALASFVDLLPVASCAMDLGEAVQMDETGGGEPLMSALGSRLWAGRYALSPMTYDEATAAQALIDLVRAPGGSFLAADLRQWGPRGDPAGAGLSGFTPALSAISTGGREIAISGAPPGYALARGDMLSFGYGTGAARRALHRVVRALLPADGGGVIPSIEVIPAVRAGTGLLPPVALVRPVMKAVIVPGSFEEGEWSNRLVRGMAFRFSQSLAG
ncbi:MAG: hypothetical protein ACT4OK_01135 [Gemmobacter sp.]